MTASIKAIDNLQNRIVQDKKSCTFFHIDFHFNCIKLIQVRKREIYLLNLGLLYISTLLAAMTNLVMCKLTVMVTVSFNYDLYNCKYIMLYKHSHSEPVRLQ